MYNLRKNDHLYFHVNVNAIVVFNDVHRSLDNHFSDRKWNGL